VGVAEDVDGPAGRVDVRPDLVVGLGFPVLDRTVPLVQPASITAISAAVTRAEPRRVGRMTPVCHRSLPAPLIALTRVLPAWARLCAAAETIVRDGQVMAGTGAGSPLPAERSRTQLIRKWTRPMPELRSADRAVGAASRWQLDDIRRHDSGLVILSYRQLL
jgi:hypothetical protein